MKITAEKLNQIASLVGATDKNIVYSFVITGLVDNGIPLSEAYDMVFGDGAYAAMVGKVYDELVVSAKPANA